MRDATGYLLLKRSQVIQRAHQIEVLIERDLSILGIDASANARAQPDTTVVPEIRSVLHMINNAENQLARVLFNLPNETDIAPRLMAIASQFHATAQDNCDIAAAVMPLNQDASAYSVRHCIDTAIVSVLVAERLRLLAAQVPSIVAAALSMNVGMLREQAPMHGKAGPLTDSERGVVQRDPEKSVALLQHEGVTDRIWLDAALLRHENQNSGGYPTGK